MWGTIFLVLQAFRRRVRLAAAAATGAGVAWAGLKQLGKICCCCCLLFPAAYRRLRGERNEERGLLDAAAREAARARQDREEADAEERLIRQRREAREGREADRALMAGGARRDALDAAATMRAMSNIDLASPELRAASSSVQ
jgi:hypothetical protein